MTTPTPIPRELLELAQRFPTLDPANTPHVPTDSIEALWEWGRTASSGEHLAVLFIVNVYSAASDDSQEYWAWPRFDVMRAMGTWDGAHIGAFISWARAPWFC